ncbi:carbohydrate sulfotransferase 1-like [Haliotis cracherodii]|uniref:carbohydrate sulfotransferase 1-like n=1 Tax=Haliotis cracherodii TaxID=6455 RepID=UPI0039EA42A1
MPVVPAEKEILPYVRLSRPTPEATKVILLAYMRTGSSFTGDIIQQSPDVFYMFEPLFSVEKYHLSHLFDINNKRFDKGKGKRQQHVLESLLTCDLTSMDPTTLTQHHLKNSYSTIDYYNCTRNVESVSDLKECLKPVLSECVKSRVVFAKVIRTKMITMYDLLSKYPELKVIHLLRDPRGLLASQKMVGHLPDGIRGSVKATCDKMYTDVKKSVSFKKKFPGRVFTIRYEDIALDPINVSKQVYDFLGIELTSTIQNYILDITANNVTRCGARCISKNSTYAAFRWREHLSYRDVSVIDHSCSELYRKVGYLAVTKFTFRDMSRTTLTDMPKDLTRI